MIDDRTGRGVPLVELRTTDDQRYVTDSAGRVAIADPGLMGQQVFFHVESHGYRHSADDFGYEGEALEVEPCGRATIEIERQNIAERLYRITGRGIYRDSVLLGYDVPISRPVLNQQVVGQDSVQAVVHNGHVHWFWGDTSRVGHPLGNFQTTGATSRLPKDGGLDPAEGVDLNYYGDGDGFTRKMAPLPTDEGNVIWIDRLVAVPDADGRRRLVARYAHLVSLGEKLSEGLVVFDEQRERFELLKTDMNLSTSWEHGRGHATATRYEDPDDGQTYWFFSRPWPTVRVVDDFETVQQKEAYESFTCLSPGESFVGEDSSVERDPGGNVVWNWKRDTGPMSQQRERRLVEAGLLAENETRFQLRDIETGNPVVIHGASIRWNEYRERWIMIGNEVGGSSYLGEVWFAEAEAPTGPWQWARRIVTHDNYTFYNPSHHAFFDQDGGRYIYFEGTYTEQFSDADFPTPLYDYNQIMYRLDLDDARLDLPLTP